MTRFAVDIGGPVTHVDGGVEVETRAARHVIGHAVGTLPVAGTARDVSIQAVSRATIACNTHTVKT